MRECFFAGLDNNVPIRNHQITKLKEKLTEQKIDTTLQSMGGYDSQAKASCSWGCSEGACTTGGCTITTCMFSTSCPGGPVCATNGCNTLSGGNTCGASHSCADAGCASNAGGVTCKERICSRWVNGITEN